MNSIFGGLPPSAPTLGLHIQTRPLPVTEDFETPVLNGAIYHQSTINDLLVEGLSFTAGLRLDYERL